MHHETYQNAAAFAPYHLVICVILASCLRHITTENDEKRRLMNPKSS
ncbi:hypothetical protein HMPREF9145_2189 [Segatella salivae F0493]|uniref:Uncharacterized protein n=1 Tax=Segatella salivae F0493 TaxID=1395125 RepID=U2MBX7_9BACT|nr:hypothetical protein HMPREF9145_2189 [Segatella salivae F0493]